MWSRQVYISLSGACLLVGVTTMHGLGGQLWHARAIGEEAANAWRFFQPFRYGADPCCQPCNRRARLEAGG